MPQPGSGRGMGVVTSDLRGLESRPLGPHCPVTLEPSLLLGRLAGHLLSTYYVLAQSRRPLVSLSPHPHSKGLRGDTVGKWQVWASKLGLCIPQACPLVAEPRRGEPAQEC